MKQISRFFIFFVLSISFFTTIAQTTGLESLGNANWISDRRYRLTEDVSFQYGAVWSTRKVSLKRPFDLLAKVNLGDKNISGAEGIAFTLHQAKSYSNLSSSSDFGIPALTPSLSVEIDTYSNPPYNDPNNDHIAIQKNGNFMHGTPENLAGPINALAGSIFLNIEDGADHFFRVTWDPVAQNMKVYFDCQERLSLDHDIIAKIFNNDEFVYWGFSAGTGVNNNKQEVEILRCSALDDYNEVAMCTAGQAVQLNASYGATFAWSPAVGLSKTDIQDPVATVNAPTIFVATVTHVCDVTTSFTFQDTFVVKIPDLVPPGWKTSIEACADKIVTLDAGTPDANSFKWDSNAVNSPTLVVTKSGTYTVTISVGNCTNTVSAVVNIYPLPVFNLGKDQKFCDNTSLVLDPRVADPTLKYLWSTGETTNRIYVTTTGSYWADLTTGNGCKFRDTIEVLVSVSSRFTESKAICQGTTYRFQGKDYGVDTTLKATLVAMNKCDSFYTLNLKVVKNTVPTVNDRFCQGSSFTFFGKKYSTPGVFNVNTGLKTFAGCDSIVNLNLSVISSDTTRQSAFICKDSILIIGGKLYSKTGVYTEKISNSIGCDSFFILNLLVDTGLGYSIKDTICAGETYLFDGKLLAQEGMYAYKLKNQNGCDSVITLQLTISNIPQVKISASKKYLCWGEQATLTSDGTFLNYLWNYKSLASSSIVVSEEGWYRVSVSDGAGCIGYDSIKVFTSLPMTLSVSKKTASCAGFVDGQISLDSIKGGKAPFTTSIDGTNFSAGRIYKGLKEGNYTLIVRDSFGCTTQLTESLLNPLPRRININEQFRIIALGDSTLVSIVPTFTDVASIVWTPSNSVNVEDLEAWLKPLRNTHYSVVVKDSSGCEFKDTVTIAVNSSLLLFVPNIFSANVDGTNDILRLHAGSSVDKILSFRVYDRWGVMVFEALDFYPTEDIGWDGSFRNKPQPEGVYIAHVKALKRNGESEDVVVEVLLIK
ncbi:MAG: lectin-like domain-containing protein [Saprospiraceae bacterium]